MVFFEVPWNTMLVPWPIYPSIEVLASDTWSSAHCVRGIELRQKKENRENMRGWRKLPPVTAHQFLGRNIDRLSRLDIREVIHFLDRRRRGARAALFVTQAKEIIDTATLSGGPLRRTVV